MRNILISFIFLILFSSFVIGQNEGGGSCDFDPSIRCSGNWIQHCATEVGWVNVEYCETGCNPETFRCYLGEVFVGEYTLESSKGILLDGKNISIGKVYVNNDVDVFINGFGKIVDPRVSFKASGVIVEVVESVYSNDLKKQKVTIKVYTIKEEGNPEQRDSDSWFFEVGDEEKLFGDRIKLLDVYDDESILVQVEESVAIIKLNEEKEFEKEYHVKGGKEVTTVKNKGAYYSEKISNRAALMEIYSVVRFEQEQSSKTFFQKILDWLKKYLIK